MVRSITSLLIVAFSAATPTNAFVSPMQQSPTRIPSSITHRNNGPLPAKDANMSEEERDAAMEKALKAMTAFSNKYVQNTNTYYCEDQSVPAVVIKGLAEHKVTLGRLYVPVDFMKIRRRRQRMVTGIALVFP
ncbi:ferredoxin-thioredoxin reductase, catalytic chain [Skeletonema marinoi]|uniref:ferredoxin:thioredoxin reductase n=1 Tax=Skeletonema marinoi TaxID=267567 RepID=A0AAD9DIF4_9STRA|nr:ferredoxin-thioredoxin reductase, catalytic chain [Skeletonema marinoi]